MLNETKIISAAIKSRKAWQSIKEHLNTTAIGTDTSTILSLVGDYYQRDTSADSADLELITLGLKTAFQQEKHQKRLSDVLKSLPEVSPSNVADFILQAKRFDLSQKLSIALARNSKDAPKLYKEYGDLLTATQLVSGATEEDDVIERFQVEDLVKRAFDPNNLIPLWPRSLTDFLGGGARPGHHILVFGPTEIGKSLIVINMLAGWVERGLRVLYVGNEDPVEDLMMRYICRLTQRTKTEVMAHPDLAQKLLEKKGYENVIFAPLAPGNFETIQRLVDRFVPTVVVLDQLRNIDVDSENRTQALEKAATQARNLAKKNALVVVSVSQASDSASGKRILTRGDVDSSNVGIPGQCDLMVGVGGTEQDEEQGFRWLSFPKNKISGDHRHFEIKINPLLSLVEEPDSANSNRSEG